MKPPNCLGKTLQPLPPTIGPRKCAARESRSRREPDTRSVPPAKRAGRSIDSRLQPRLGRRSCHSAAISQGNQTRMVSLPSDEFEPATNGCSPTAAASVPARQSRADWSPVWPADHASHGEPACGEPQHADGKPRRIRPANPAPRQLSFRHEGFPWPWSVRGSLPCGAFNRLALICRKPRASGRGRGCRRVTCRGGSPLGVVNQRRRRQHMQAQ